MVKRKNRLLTDALREVWKTRNRFFSLFLLCALAVCFLSGLRTTAPDMQYTADLYFDARKLMDVRVLSTMGLTGDDLAALAAREGVSEVEGSRSLDAICGERILSVQSLPGKLNLPTLREGRLPEKENECLAEPSFLAAAGLGLGDAVKLDLEASDHQGDLVTDTFTIVGTADSPMYISVDRGSSTLGTGRVNAVLFVPDSAFTLDYYTAAYLSLAGLEALDCYDDAYEDAVDGFLDAQEDFAQERARLRHDSIVGDAQEELDEARQEYEDAKADADRELADAEQELKDARKKLDDGWKELEDGREELQQENADASAELAEAYTKLQDAIGQYHDGEAEYLEAAAELEDGLEELERQQLTLDDSRRKLNEQQAVLDESKRTLDAQQAELNEQKAALDAQQIALDAQKAELEAGLAQYEAAVSAYPDGSPEQAAVIAQLAEQKAQLDAGLAQVEAGQAQLTGGFTQLEEGQAQLDEGYAQLQAGQVQLDEGMAQLNSGQAELDRARAEIVNGRTELDKAKRELDDAWAEILQGQADYRQGTADLDRAVAEAEQELDEAEQELNDGEAEYADGLKEYEDAKAEAEEELADAKDKLDDAQDEINEIEKGEWYVLGRDTLAGYVTYGSDSERMSNLADVFPVIFFLVAALACLTTMTRMVDEQRTQIGCLKALGYTRGAISVKYIGYAFAASFFGGIVGAVLGCIIIPLVIYNAWGIMYTLPAMSFLFQPGICVLAILAAVACTTGASLAACMSTLTASPAALMRPRAPKAGRRVLLERVGPVWRRMSFTWKVTVRNLFRYKRRFWMTVIGIGGCTALIVTGFGIHYSIFDILTRQYDEITPYNASVGLSDSITGEQLDIILRHLEDDPNITSYLTSYQTTVDADSEEGVVEGVNLFAVEDMDAFRSYVHLRHRVDGSPVSLPREGIVITEKLSELLGVGMGDTITIDDGDRRIELKVGDITENYVYHYIYLTEDYYEALFGERPVQNSIMLNFADDSDAASDRVSTEVMKLRGVSTYTHIAYIRDTFTDSMASIDYAVVIIILAAAALASVVLYNLTNINITERMRELATLKVLGFYDGEVSAYVYRENIFLTLFGILMGLGMGRFLHAWLVRTVEVNMVMFGRTATPVCYALAVALTAVFSVAVNIVAHYSMKKIDMVESLKTVE